MRIGALLLVGFGLLAAGACATTTVVDAECIQNGGVCFMASDPSGCGGGALPYGCQKNYQCCATVYAANVVEGGVLKDVSNGAPTDGDVSVVDAVDDAEHTDAAVAAESGIDAAKDVTTHD